MTVKWIDDVRPRVGDLVELTSKSEHSGWTSSYIGVAFTKTYLYPWTGSYFGHAVGIDSKSEHVYKVVPQPWWMRIFLFLAAMRALRGHGGLRWLQEHRGRSS